MDERIRSIINNPNFGRAYRSNATFRSFIQNQASDAIRSSLTKFEFTKDGLLRDENGRTLERASGETFLSYLHRNAIQAKLGITQVRHYTPDTRLSNRETRIGSTYYSGGQTNYPLIQAAREHGLTARITSFRPDPKENAVAYLDRIIGRDAQGIIQGMINPDDDQITILQMFDKDNQSVNLKKIYDVLGVEALAHPSVFKRIKAFTSDRQIARAADPNNRIKTLLFDPAELFGTNPQLVKAAQRAVELGDVDNLKEAYNIMSDGLSIITESGMQRNLDYMSQEVKKMTIELDDKLSKNIIRRGSTLHRENEETIKAITEEIDRVKRGMRKGTLAGGFNVRVFGAHKWGTTDEVVDFSKGDAIYFSKAKVKEFLGRLGKYTPDEIETMANELDIITSEGDIKPELRARARSMMTLFHQPGVHKGGKVNMAYSNSLTMATMAELTDPVMGSGDRYLLHSMKSEINEAIEGIKKGVISPGLMKIVEDIEKTDKLGTAVDLNTAEQIEIQQGQLFAKRLRNFIKGGGDLSSNPVMAQQAMDAIRKHHFRTVTDGKGNAKKVMFGGVEQDQLTLRSPMRMAIRTHMANAEMVGRNIAPGMASYDEATDRYVFSGTDILSARAAQGGSDLDDALYMSMKYDPKARRAFYHSLRDPNAMGEYMFYDVDILTDPNLPKEIKDLEGRKRMLIEELKNSKNKAGTSKRVRELDSINEKMHKYFSGDAIRVGGVTISQRDIATVDVAKQYAIDEHRTVFAPKGYKKTSTSLKNWATGSVQRGFGTSVQAGGIDQYLSALTASGNAIGGYSPFEFVGKGYIDFVDDNKLLKRNKTIEGIIKSASKIDIKDLPLLTQEDIFTRISQEAAGRGNLGRFVNQFSLVERFVQDYTNIDRFGPGVNQKKAKEFQRRMLKLIESKELTMVEREAVIDAFVKTGDVRLLDEIPKLLTENAFKLGELITQGKALASEIGLDIDVGIDPYLYETRGLTMRDDLLRGLGGNDVSRALLSESDPMAYMSSVFKDFTDLNKTVNMEMGPDLIKFTSQNLLDELGDFAPTPLEVTRAQQFIDDYVRNVDELQTRLADSDSLIRMIDGNLDASNIQDLMAPYTDDAVQVKSLLRLKEWGLLDDIDGLDRQLIAIGQLAAQQAVDTPGGIGMGLQSLMRGSADRSLPSIDKLFMAARFRITRQEDKIIKAINSIDPSQYLDMNSALGDYLRFEDNKYKLINDAALDEVDQSRTAQALINKMQTMRRLAYNDAVKKDSTSSKRRAIGDARNRIDSAIRQLQSIQSPEPARRVELPGGIDRYIARENADQVADDVIDTTGSATTNLQKAFGRQSWNTMMGIPGARKAAIGAGLFFGFGLLYGVTKDRTFEDMQGPALLPGGSAYEEFDQVPANLSSIYSSPNRSGPNSGILYKVNMNGSFDSNQVRNRIQGITGSPIDSRIHSARQTNQGIMSSQQLMNQYVG